MKTEESKYKDCNGHIIFYGDILRLKDYKRESENSPKEPFFMRYSHLLYCLTVWIKFLIISQEGVKRYAIGYM